MRIVAGDYGGRRLKSVAGLSTRPTADRVKEAVFSSISGRLMDARVLDVFGGTGAIALEALSRKAKTAVILEKDNKAARVIADNMALCRAEGQCRLLKGDALTLLKRLGREGAVFDLIYVDPPYQAGLYESVLEYIGQNALLAQGGLVILESAKDTAIALADMPFAVDKERIYGDTKIWYLTAAAIGEELL